MALPNLEKVREAFDRMAPSMDTAIVSNPITAWMHAINLRKIRAAFPPGSRLLELGCGTGADAMALASQGHAVFALDLSEKMVAIARAKVIAHRLADRVTVVRGRSSDLLSLMDHSPWKTFDGAYANFTLTYEEDLTTIADALHRVLRPQAPFLCSIPNRVVLSEILLYGSQLRFAKALWRYRDPLYKNLGECCLRIHAYSPWQVREAFRGRFELRELVGLPVFLPPNYLHPYYRGMGRAQSVFERADALLAGRFPWNRLGDHTLFRFERSSPRHRARHETHPRGLPEQGHGHPDRIER